VRFHRMLSEADLRTMGNQDGARLSVAWARPSAEMRGGGVSACWERVWKPFLGSSIGHTKGWDRYGRGLWRGKDT